METGEQCSVAVKNQMEYYELLWKEQRANQNLIMPLCKSIMSNHC